MQSRIVGAVEIGTSKMAVLVGEIDEDSSLHLIGEAHCSSKGVKKGTITDLNQASDCIHTTILAAEKHAHTRIDEIYLAQTGQHLDGMFNLGTATVGSSDRVIREDDIERAKDDAKRRKLPDNRTYLHHIRNPYLIDGAMVENPLSKVADRVQVGYWSVHGDRRIVSDCLRVINGIDMRVSDIIVSSIASASILLSDSEKDAGALVIDIGGGTSDYALFRNGYIIRTGVVPVGGDHITNDLSIGLRIGRKSAEEIKIRDGRACYASSDREETVWLVGDLTIGDHQLSMASITKIIEARIDEIFRIIHDQLGDAWDAAEMVSGVVLTGGTARLPMIDTLAEKVFGAPARVGTGPAYVKESLRAPEYSTVLGLMQYALMGQEERGMTRKSAGGLIRKVASLFNFD